MGYRTYIGQMPKRDYNKVKSLDLKALHEAYGHEFSFYKQTKELYEFGKYVDFDPPKGSTSPFFKKKEVKEQHEDYNPLVVTKEFLAYVINKYRQHVIDYYNDMYAPFLDSESMLMKSVKPEVYKDGDIQYTMDFSQVSTAENIAIKKCLDHVREFRAEWVCLTPFDLDEGDSITKSWKFEYNVFELVRIYKSFDWKRDVMVCYGY